MEITFLGTSSGTPTKTRNVSGIVASIRDAKKWCLVDCGEGTQHQLLHTRYSLNGVKIFMQAIINQTQMHSHTRLNLLMLQC